MWIDQGGLCYRLLVAGRISVVTFNHSGHEWYSSPMAGRSLKSSEMPSDPSPILSCRGPKPGPDVIFTVSLVGDDRKWRVEGKKPVSYLRTNAHRRTKRHGDVGLFTLDNQLRSAHSRAV